MKLKTMFKKYPLAEAVMNQLIEMKSNDRVTYKELKDIWQRRMFELYPNDWKRLKFPSRQTLWKLEKEYWFIVCPLCNEKVHRTETREAFMTEPKPHWTRICKKCYTERKWQYYRTKGHSPRIEDYLYVKRNNVPHLNPRDET